MQSNSAQKFKLTVNSSKTTYNLGETIDLSFSLRNEGNDSVRVGNYFDVKDGYLKIWISQDGITFKEYSNSKWGIADVIRGSIILSPNESIETSTEILWNFVPDAANNSRLPETQIANNYAFSTKGKYFLKVKYLTHSSDKITEIESEPIQVTVTEPVGEDLEVWNRIKDNGDFAYFIQESDFRIPSYKTQERAKFQKAVEQLINHFPNSFYAQSLRRSLAKFKDNENKRKARSN